MRAIFPPDDEERLIEEFFGHAKSGYFVDVGAAHPQFGSQSWHLEQAGWSGVVVEPRPDMAQQLRQARRAKVYEVACSSPRNAGRTMPMQVAADYSSLNDTLVIAALRPQGVVSVAIRTLDDILEDARAPAPIDFVSLDVEGHEIEVLEGFDLERWRPRLILTEDHVLDLRLHRLLQRRGYKWVRRTSLNGWYVPADSRMRVSWPGWLQFIRKYYLALPFRHIRDFLRHLRVFAGWSPPKRDGSA
jgi:FkbM family methyltransferase